MLLSTLYKAPSISSPSTLQSSVYSPCPLSLSVLSNMTMEDSDSTLSVVFSLPQFLPGALKMDLVVQDNNDDGLRCALGLGGGKYIYIYARYNHFLQFAILCLQPAGSAST